MIKTLRKNSSPPFAGDHWKSGGTAPASLQWLLNSNGKNRTLFLNRFNNIHQSVKQTEMLADVKLKVLDELIKNSKQRRVDLDKRLPERYCKNKVTVSTTLPAAMAVQKSLCHLWHRKPATLKSWPLVLQQRQNKTALQPK